MKSIPRDVIQGFSIFPLKHDKNDLTAEHCHKEGQLYLLSSGMITCYSKDKRWSITPHCLGLIPPMLTHSAISWGGVTGWVLYFPPHIWNLLPQKICLLESSSFISALIARIALFTNLNTLSYAESRILHVLLDEIKQSKQIRSLLLPYPQDARLIKIVKELLSDLANSKSQSQWANWAGISVRSLSRHFMNETGMTFSRWRQLAKVMASLEKLAQGDKISDIAYSLGFSDASAYIASFKSIFGISPTGYFTG